MTKPALGPLQPTLNQPIPSSRPSEGQERTATAAKQNAPRSVLGEGLASRRLPRSVSMSMPPRRGFTAHAAGTVEPMLGRDGIGLVGQANVQLGLQAEGSISRPTSVRLGRRDVDVNMQMSGKASAGANAEATGFVGVSSSKIGAEGNANAFVGVSAAVSGKVDVGHVTVGTEARAMAGIGLRASGKLVLERDENNRLVLRMKGSAGAAVGVGASVGLNASINLQPLANRLQRVVDRFQPLVNTLTPVMVIAQDPIMAPLLMPMVSKFNEKSGLAIDANTVAAAMHRLASQSLRALDEVSKLSDFTDDAPAVAQFSLSSAREKTVAEGQWNGEVKVALPRQLREAADQLKPFADGLKPILTAEDPIAAGVQTIAEGFLAETGVAVETQAAAAALFWAVSDALRAAKRARRARDSGASSAAAAA